MQAEVESGRVDEQRIGHYRVHVVSFGLPLGEAQAAGKHRGGPRCVEVAVVVEPEVAVGPVSAQRLDTVREDQVSLQREGVVLLLPGAADLTVGGREGQHVVPHDVVAAVMLVEGTVFNPIDDVVFHQDIGTPFVGVESPTAVRIRDDVVDPVPAKHRARRKAQAIDAAHVAELSPAEMVNVVVLDQVVMGRRRGISPTPADRNPRIEEVANLVVTDRISRASADPHTHAGVIHLAAVVDEAVEHFVTIGLEPLIVRHTCLAYPHAACTQVVYAALFDPVLLAAGLQPEPIPTGSGDRTPAKDATPGTVGPDGSLGDLGGRLAVDGLVGRHHPIGVLEGEPFELEVLDEPPRCRIAIQPQQLLDNRYNDLGGGHLFAKPRVIGYHARPAVDVPLARCIECRANTLDVVSLLLLPPTQWPTARGRKGDQPLRGVERLDVVPRCGPGMVDHQHGVVEVGPLLQVVTMIEERRLDLRVPTHFLLFRVCNTRPGGSKRVDVGRSGRSRAATVYEQLPAPSSGEDLRLHGCRPKRPLGLLPAGYRHRTADHRLLAIGSGVDDRRGSRARVVGRENDRAIDPVRAATNHHPSRLAGRTVREQLPDGIPGGLERGQRPVATVGRRLGQPAGPGIVSVGRDEKVSLGRIGPQ